MYTDIREIAVTPSTRLIAPRRRDCLGEDGYSGVYRLVTVEFLDVREGGVGTGSTLF
jgi:hypothetical protein